jgi:cytochrome c oxidase subunit 4
MTATEHAEVAESAGHVDHAEHSHAHPSDAQYILIAAILAAITALEVATYYLEFFKTNFVALLIALIPMMIVKFAIVAAFFMHLKFDNKLFRRIFITGILLATFVYMIVLFSFHVFSH